MATMAPRYFRQNDTKRWGGETLGLGSSTIGGAGCLLLTVGNLMGALLGDTPLPPDLNRRLIEAGAFDAGRSGTPPARMARAAGLVVDEAGARFAPGHSVTAMAAAIRKALCAGGGCILWVDHDADKANGDAEGDHFVAALRLDGVDVIYADPVNGEALRLPLSTLAGASVWRRPKTRGASDPGDVRSYRVRAVWPVYSPTQTIPT